MATHLQKIRRLWRRSPVLVFAYIRRKASNQARRIMPQGEWNINWLGEEMRPYNP